MVVYSHYSDSHKEIYNDFFYSSLRKIYSKADLKLRILHHEQTTAEGKFMSPGWLETMNYKISVILTAIDECKGGWFIFSDCDVQFFAPFIDDIAEQIKEKDIVCQEDRGSLCAGFFACKANENTKRLWELIKVNFRTLVNDQAALNYFRPSINYNTLDKNKYYTVGNFFENPNGTFIWDNITNIIPPKNILIHHANYVEGTKNKISLLKMIRKNYDKLHRNK